MKEQQNEQYREIVTINKYKHVVVVEHILTQERFVRRLDDCNVVLSQGERNNLKTRRG